MMLDILLKSVAAGALVAIVLVCVRLGKPELAGVLLSFPALTIVSYLFIGHGQGSEQLLQVVKVSIMMLPLWALFMLATYLLLRHTDYRMAVAGATFCWMIAAIGIVRWIS